MWYRERSGHDTYYRHESRTMELWPAYSGWYLWEIRDGKSIASRLIAVESATQAQKIAEKGMARIIESMTREMAFEIAGPCDRCLEDWHCHTEFTYTDGREVTVCYHCSLVLRKEDETA